DRLGDFPKDRDLVAYCRGPYCVLAVEAVQRLAAFGFNAVRLEDGVAEWRARGFAVVTEEE
ncbi:MAG: ArsR family transcriptional regulator, partial [Gemmatimonadota bacterium]|nr:ArsR family transcriptional regulator [Gemmatimonadota bacterium]